MANRVEHFRYLREICVLGTCLRAVLLASSFITLQLMKSPLVP